MGSGRAQVDGTCTIEAWHEICGTETQEVAVKEGETETVSFTFKLPQRRARR